MKKSKKNPVFVSYHGRFAEKAGKICRSKRNSGGVGNPAGTQKIFAYQYFKQLN